MRRILWAVLAAALCGLSLPARAGEPRGGLIERGRGVERRPSRTRGHSQIVVGSGSGSRLGAHAYADGKVILVIGHQKPSATWTKGSAAYANTALRENTAECSL